MACCDCLSLESLDWAVDGTVHFVMVSEHEDVVRASCNVAIHLQPFSYVHPWYRPPEKKGQRVNYCFLNERDGTLLNLIY